MSDRPSPAEAGELLEYSVVYNDRSLNHMSVGFRRVMRKLSATLKRVYAADRVAVVPGGGTYAMESVARQFGGGKRCLVVRNGWFSYRWTQIFEAGSIPADATVLRARPVDPGDAPGFAPPPVGDVTEAIRDARAEVVFAPHVETASGIVLPDGYIHEVGAAARSADALFVLDCVASGAEWVDMRKLGVDVLISAPQKSWSSPPCAGLVMLSRRAAARVDPSADTSFSCGLGHWLQVMERYEKGAHAYHATMPTDSLRILASTMAETGAIGFRACAERQRELGRSVRKLMSGRGFASVAAPGFEAASVVVCHTDDPSIHDGSLFAANGLRIAPGVPLRCGEPERTMTFRLGMFGLDKLNNIERTVERLERAVDGVVAASAGCGGKGRGISFPNDPWTRREGVRKEVADG